MEKMTMEPPQHVGYAVELLYAAAGIDLLGKFWDASLLTQVQLSSNLDLILSFVIELAGFGLSLFLIRTISARHNWARIVFLLIFIHGLKTAGDSTFLDEASMPRLLAFVAVLLQAGALILLFEKNR